MTTRIYETTDDGMSIFYDPEGGGFPFYLPAPEGNRCVFQSADDARDELNRRAEIFDSFERREYTQSGDYLRYILMPESVRRWSAYSMLSFNKKTGVYVLHTHTNPDFSVFESPRHFQTEAKAVEAFEQSKRSVDYAIKAEAEFAANAASTPEDDDTDTQSEPDGIFDRLRSWLAA